MIWRWATIVLTILGFVNLAIAIDLAFVHPRRDVVFQYHVRCLDPTSVRFQ